MNITECEVTAAMTLPTGQFGNVRPEVRFKCTLEPGEDAAAAAAALHSLAATCIRAQVVQLSALHKELR